MPDRTAIRTAVVTGAARGIGAAIAARLVAEGVRVVINDVDEAVLAETASAIGAVPFAGDAASADGVDRLVEAALREFRDEGGIDL